MHLGAGSGEESGEAGQATRELASRRSKVRWANCFLLLTLCASGEFLADGAK